MAVPGTMRPEPGLQRGCRQSQRGLASVLLLSLLGAVLLLALASLLYQQQLALRAQAHEGRYGQWLVAAENALQRAAWVLAAGASAPQLLAEANVNEQWVLVDGEGRADWPHDQIWQLCANAGDDGAAARLCQWWWQRPLLRQLPPAALLLGAASPPLAVELASREDLFSSGRQLWSQQAQPLAASSRLCLAAAFSDGLCLDEPLPVVALAALSQPPSGLLLGVAVGPAPLGLFVASGGTPADCGTLLHSQPLLWWPGDCRLDAGQYGAAPAPVLLLIKDGDLQLAAGAHLFGLVLLSGGAAGVSLDQAPGALLQGALASDGPLQLVNGPLRLLYDPELLQPLLQLRVAEALPGSWRDW